MSMKSLMCVSGGLLGLAMMTAPMTAMAGPDAAPLWKKCAACHGPDGKGKTKMGEKMGIADMSAPAWQKDMTDDKIKKTITEGVKREKDGKKQDMKGSATLKPEEVDALLALIRTFK